MNSSRRDPRRDNTPRQVPPPPGSRGAGVYTRFIPREELQDFSAWLPEALGEPHQPGAAGATARVKPAPSSSDAPAAPVSTGFAAMGPASIGRCAVARPAPAAAPAPPPPPEDAGPSAEEVHADMLAEMQQQVAAARQQGYQDGYRDGLVALDSFKESYASQVSTQVGALLQSLDAELGQLEQAIAAGVARVATELARQVVRSELVLRPALVAQVAQEAINAVLMSARHITVQVHPDDHALVAQGCEEALAARGARLLAQPALQRGGCRVESDVGVIDARVATRWAQATQALGSGVAWDDDEAAHEPEGGDA